MTGVFIKNEDLWNEHTWGEYQMKIGVIIHKLRNYQKLGGRTRTNAFTGDMAVLMM